MSGSAIQRGDSLAGHIGPKAKYGDSHMARKIALIALVAGVLTLNACNTVRGIGRDVESVGKTVKKVPD
jgi:predicted small secreted protein